MKIIQGDCFVILPEIGAVDMVVMDPPYVFFTRSCGGRDQSAFSWTDTLNASVFFRNIFEICLPKIPNGCLWVFCNWRTMIPIQKALLGLGKKIESVLIWDKGCIGLGGVGLRPTYELVIFVACGNAKLPNRSLPDIWRHKWSSARPTGHPAEKPVDLLRKIIRETPGDVVLDPFAGSGSAGVAAFLEGKDYIGIEMEEKWVSVAKRRIEKAKMIYRANISSPSAQNILFQADFF